MKSAILLIDVQQLWSEGVKTAFPGFENNIRKLVSLANENDIPLIYIYADYDRKQRDIKWMNTELVDSCLSLSSNEPSSFLTQLIKSSENGKSSESATVIKTTFNGFDATNLDDILKEKEISHVYVAGLITSVCVLMTAHGAFTRGYYVNVIQDCCGDNSVDIHESTIKNYSRMMWNPISLYNLVSCCHKDKTVSSLRSKL